MNSCIITLDIINEICHKNGKISHFHDRIKNLNIIETINKLTPWGRTNNQLIAHMKVGFNANYQDSSTSLAYL